MDVLLLHLLAKGPRHGYDLIRDIQAMAGAQYTPSSGAIYPVLRKLAASGMVTVAAQEGSRKHVYELTSVGLKRLKDEPAAIARVLTRIEALIHEPSSDSDARIRQAFDELGSTVNETVDAIPQEYEIKVVSQIASITRLLRRISKRAHAKLDKQVNDKD